jgi:hypothetical protein
MVVLLLGVVRAVTNVDDLAGETSRVGSVRLRLENGLQKSCRALCASGRRTLTGDVMLPISKANSILILLRLTKLPVLPLIPSMHWHVLWNREIRWKRIAVVLSVLTSEQELRR